MTIDEAWNILSAAIETEYADDDMVRQCIRIKGTYYGLKAVMAERSESCDS